MTTNYSSKHDVIEASRLFLDLSKGLINRLDLFLSNSNLDKKQQEELIKLFEEVYSEAYTNSLTD